MYNNAKAERTKTMYNNAKAAPPTREQTLAPTKTLREPTVFEKAKEIQLYMGELETTQSATAEMLYGYRDYEGSEVPEEQPTVQPQPNDSIESLLANISRRLSGAVGFQRTTLARIGMTRE